jgi:ADP-heptose:LPS heptosyltransferase
MDSITRNVLVYRLGSLGDTVVALPCFHKIKEAYPDAFITLLTNKPVATKAAPLEAILGEEYFFNSLLAYPLGTRNLFVLIALIRQIRKLKIDVVVNLAAIRSKKAMVRDRLFFQAAGVKKLVGFPADDLEFKPRIDNLTGYQEWEAARLTRRIRALGDINLTDDRFWDLRFNQKELDEAGLFLAGFSKHKPILVISVGTKRQPNDWEEYNWLTLVTQLSLILKDWQLIMIGASEETDRANRCMEAWNNTKINLCGKTSPRVSAAVLKHVNMFIGHDSGPLHLASCMGVPCVAIFSSRNLPGQWYPRGRFNKVIQHIPECVGCKLEECVIQKKKCILSITVDEVLVAITDLLTTIKY